MALSNEMRRLTKGFLAAHDDRVAMVATIRKDTAQELSGFRAAHQSMAADQRRHLADHVCGLRDNITRMLASLDTAHQSMASDQRQRLTEYVYRLHDNVTSMMASLDTAHQSMAAKQRQGLTDYVCGLRDNITNMLESLDKAHQSMAADQRRRLADHVYGLRDNITRMLESLDAAHQRMAAKQQKRLAAGRTHLASDVSKMRGRLHADQGEACKIWNDFSIVMGERRAKKSGAPSPKSQTAKARKPAPPAAGKATADDLTTIKGLGPARQVSLKKMGIHTFAQLAKSAPQKIRKALGASGPLANVEEWIKEARKRCK